MRMRYFEDGGGTGSGEGNSGEGPGAAAAAAGAMGDTGAAPAGDPGGSPGGSFGGFGGSGSDTGSGIYDLLGNTGSGGPSAPNYLSSNYTPQDSTQRQFYQPVYEASYQDYNQGNPLAVSSYGQDYSSPFGQFVNPFSYSPQFYAQQFYAPQANYMGGQGIGGLNPFGDYGMQDYGIAGLSR